MSLTIGLVLITASKVGGSQKRFAQMFSYLSSNSNNQYFLVLPEALFTELCFHNILKHDQKNIIPILSDLPYSACVKIIQGERLLDRAILIPLLRRGMSSEKVQSILSSFDIVHFCPATSILVMPAGKTVIIEDPSSRSEIRPPRFMLEHLKNGAYVHCLTDRIAQGYMRAISNSLGLKERVFTAPCSFIDYSKVSIAAKERLIVFAARMESIKNPELFVSAIEIVSRQRHDFSALMLGTGELDQRIDSLIHQKGLNSKLTRYFSSNPLSELSRAAVFVSIQEYDNYPSQSLIEAMASGCALISSDRGDTKRLVTSDVGFLVPLRAEAIAERLIWMLDNFNDTIIMGERARQRVMREHTIERFTKHLEGVYEKIYEKVRAKY